MKKLAVSLGRILFVLLLLAGLSVCEMAEQPEGTPPEDALSFDQMLANLEALKDSTAENPSVPGKSMFSLPDGSLLSSADLSAYINAIKRDLAAYIYSCTGGAPYLVVPIRVPASAVPGSTTSGLAWVPFTWRWGTRFPVISLQHGTQVYEQCAPSRFNANPLAVLTSPDLTGALQNYVECIVGGLMASAGYIVVMPDYQGFGDTAAVDHPYVHLSLGESVRDLVVWAQSHSLGPRGARANELLYLTGYSEGGYTTMAGAIMLGSAVTKVVPCDGAYDLSGTMLEMMLSEEPINSPHYLLYTASGYDEAYRYTDPDPIDLTTLLTNADPTWWATKAATLFDGTHTNAEVSAAVPASTPPASMLTDSAKSTLLVEDGAVYELLEGNNAWEGWGFAPTPVFVHCPYDDVVSYANAEIAAEAFGLDPEDPDVIHEVFPIPFVAQVMGSIHVGAYPTAMLEAFKIIRGN